MEITKNKNRKSYDILLDFLLVVFVALIIMAAMLFFTACTCDKGRQHLGTQVRVNVEVEEVLALLNLNLNLFPYR
jgi:hypothetical protein